MENQSIDKPKRGLDKEIWDRLMIIHNTIKNGGDSRPESLALECKVEKITIYRDIATIKKEFNAPLLFDRITKRYYYKDSGFELVNQSVSPEEFMALSKLKIFASKLKGNSEMYKKISEVIDYITDYEMPGNSAVINRIYEIQNPKEKIENPDLWRTIMTAISENRILKITRKNYTGNPKLFFYPYQIILDEGNYYIWGSEEWQKETCNSNSRHLISINAIETAELTNVSFELPVDYSYDYRPKIEYKIKLFGVARNNNITFGENQRITDEDDESVTVSFQTSKNENYVLFWILAQGADIVPLEPAHLVDSWRYEINCMAQKSEVYKDWVWINTEEVKHIQKEKNKILELRLNERKNKKKSSRNQVYDSILWTLRFKNRMTFEYIKNMTPQEMKSQANELIPKIPRIEIFHIAYEENIFNHKNEIDLDIAQEIINHAKKNY